MPLFSLLAMVILSMIGIADASYITYEEFAGIIPKCTAFGGIFKCATVLQSQWSHIGPIPLSLLGVFFYSTVFVVVSYLLVVKKPIKPAKQLIPLVGTFGFLFSLYLTFIQAFIIEAFCLYCVISAITTTLIFLASWVYTWPQRHDLLDFSTHRQ